VWEGTSDTHREWKSHALTMSQGSAFGQLALCSSADRDDNSCCPRKVNSCWQTLQGSRALDGGTREQEWYMEGGTVHDEASGGCMVGALLVGSRRLRKVNSKQRGHCWAGLVRPGWQDTSGSDCYHMEAVFTTSTTIGNEGCGRVDGSLGVAACGQIIIL